MSVPDLNTLLLSDPEVRAQFGAGRLELATKAAASRFCDALGDLAVIEVACGRLDSAVQKLQNAVNTNPASQAAFHNLVATLLKSGKLTGTNLHSVVQRVEDDLERVPWMRQYQRLLTLPWTVSLEFVEGKCNLCCRMCIGRNSADYPDRLSWMSPERFDEVLAAAPTTSGYTLSSGNSDPLLHPHIDRIIETAARYGKPLGFFTNGHALSERQRQAMVDSGTVHMLNISIDAATPETYSRIRGGDFDKLIEKIEALQALKKERGAVLPCLSLSFVGMADNIQELPDYVRLAARLGAFRVLVEDLIGWQEASSQNLPATENRRCFEYVSQAEGLASEAGLTLEMPELLKARSAEVPAATVPAPGDQQPPEASDTSTPERLACCPALRDLWVRMDGSLDPCCMIHDVVDMGHVTDGPLLHNEKYARVKELLFEGKVLAECVDQRQCRYVQQQLADGRPLRVISRDELGELHRDRATQDDPASATTPTQAEPLQPAPARV